MKRRHLMMGGAAAMSLGACSPRTKFKSYSGPDVTYIVVNKDARRMYLLHDDKVLKDYVIDLGFAPIGDKFFEGDGRTPEGNYLIDRRNPNSQFHLSLGISYPNERDRAEAAALGKPPGGDIFIHGESSHSSGGATTGHGAVLQFRTARWKMSMPWYAMARRSRSTRKRT